MLDYKDIIIKHYGLGLSGSAISKQLGVSKSGVNDFIRAFERCDKLNYPLPAGITNYGIAELVAKLLSYMMFHLVNGDMRKTANVWVHEELNCTNAMYKRIK